MQRVSEKERETQELRSQLSKKINVISQNKAQIQKLNKDKDRKQKKINELRDNSNKIQNEILGMTETNEKLKQVSNSSPFFLLFGFKHY